MQKGTGTNEQTNTDKKPGCVRQITFFYSLGIILHMPRSYLCLPIIYHLVLWPRHLENYPLTKLKIWVELHYQYHFWVKNMDSNTFMQNIS